MLELHKYLSNPFNDPRLAMNELIAFSTDHLSRLTVNNPGAVFASRITATTAALTGVEGSYTDDQTALALRKSKKRVKDNFREALPGSIGKIHGAVTAQYGVDGVEVTEIFPKGRSVFNRAPDGALAEELQTMANGLTAHQADLGAPVVASGTGLVSGWQAVFQTSVDSTGNKAKSTGDKQMARAALQLELFKNLLTIALNFPDQPGQLDAYMQGNLLFPHTHTATTPAPAPTPPATTTK